MLQRLSNFAALEWRSKGLVAEAAIALLVARLTLLFVPFPVLARRFGDFVPPTDPRVAAARSAEDETKHLILAVRWAVGAAARNVPFRAVCLPQAIAARAMLKRRRIASVMHFGAGFGKLKAMDAHAWLDAGGLPVTGYPISPEIAEIACFVPAKGG